LRDRKTNFRSFIYSLSSTNPANLVNIGVADVEIIGQKLLKNKGNREKLNKKHRQNISPPSRSPGGLINSDKSNSIGLSLDP